MIEHQNWGGGGFKHWILQGTKKNTLDVNLRKK